MKRRVSDLCREHDAVVEGSESTVIGRVDFNVILDEDLGNKGVVGSDGIVDQRFLSIDIIYTVSAFVVLFHQPR